MNEFIIFVGVVLVIVCSIDAIIKYNKDMERDINVKTKADDYNKRREWEARHASRDLRKEKNDK